MLYMRHERSKQRGAWLPAAAAAIASLIFFSSPASGSVRITYSASSDYTVSDIVTADLDAVDGLTLDQTGQSLDVASSSFTDPHIWRQAPHGVMLMGERQDALGSPHLVFGVSQSYAARLVGQSFSSLFPIVNEHLVLGSLELVSDNVSYDPALQTLFYVSKMVVNGGGAFEPDGGKFTLISFSSGQVIGSGLASLESSPPVATDVPEPATWTMMMIGFGLVGGTLRGIRNDKTNIGRAVPGMGFPTRQARNFAA